MWVQGESNKICYSSAKLKRSLTRRGVPVQGGTALLEVRGIEELSLRAVPMSQTNECVFCKGR